MPYIIGLFWGALAQLLSSFVGRILVQLGITYITYQGIDGLISNIKPQAIGYLTQIPATIRGIVGLTQIGACISVICSALTAKFVINGLSGSVTKMKIK